MKEIVSSNEEPHLSPSGDDFTISTKICSKLSKKSQAYSNGVTVVYPTSWGDCDEIGKYFVNWKDLDHWANIKI